MSSAHVLKIHSFQAVFTVKASSAHSSAGTSCVSLSPSLHGDVFFLPLMTTKAVSHPANSLALLCLHFIFPFCPFPVPCAAPLQTPGKETRQPCSPAPSHNKLLLPWPLITAGSCCCRSLKRSLCPSRAQGSREASSLLKTCTCSLCCAGTKKEERPAASVAMLIS